MGMYINPAVKRQTMELLKQYKAEHPYTATPMADVAGSAEKLTDADRARFVRAARALGWDVVKSDGSWYEGGVKIWTTSGNSEKVAAN